jgi:hypothetical protein
MPLKDKETKERNAAEARLRNKPLSKRERRFAAHVHRGMTDLDAALLAGYPETSAHTRACELRADPRIQLLLSDMAEKEVSPDGRQTRVTWSSDFTGSLSSQFSAVGTPPRCGRWSSSGST